MRKFIVVTILCITLILGSLASVSALTIKFPEGNDLEVNTFEPSGGWGNASLLVIGSRALAISFGLMLVAWIFIIIFAAIRIIRDPGEGLPAGSKRIQNVFYGISFGLLFFVAISFLGSLAGLGNVFQWSESLQECSCERAAEGETCYFYKFQAEASYEDNVNPNWQCYGEDDVKYQKGWQTPIKLKPTN